MCVAWLPCTHSISASSFFILVGRGRCRTYCLFNEVPTAGSIVNVYGETCFRHVFSPFFCREYANTPNKRSARNSARFGQRERMWRQRGFELLFDYFQWFFFPIEGPWSFGKNFSRSVGKLLKISSHWNREFALLFSFSTIIKNRVFNLFYQN